MANNDAWNAGWKTGKDAAKGKQKKTAKPVNRDTTPDEQTLTSSASLKSYHRGGKVRHTGPAKLKKGEIVLTTAQARACGVKTRKKSHGQKRAVTKQ